MNRLPTRSLAAFLAALTLTIGAGAAEWPDFQAQGTGPGSDHSRIGGLGFTVLLNPPRLWKIPAIPVSGQYWTPKQGVFPGPRLPMDLGTVSCGEPMAVKELERDWAHVGLELSPRLKLQVTRLSPALVFDCAAPQLTLFGGGKTTPIAFATAGGVFGTDQPLDKAQMNPGASWLLLWFGKDAGLLSTRHPWPGCAYMDGAQKILSPVDCPILVLFANAPASLTAKDGVTFAATEQGPLGKVVLLPLFGDLYPGVAETEAWSKGAKLPATVDKACQWWAEHLAEVPLSARERFGYDDQTGTVTLSSRITYAKIRDGGQRLAPLPPVLSLAREQGFPLELSGKPVRSSVITAVGPYACLEGVDQYECRVTGLAKFVREASAPEDAAKEPGKIMALLTEEVAKITLAGHLTPWYPAHHMVRYDENLWNFGQGLVVFSTPETLAILGEALPFLDQNQQEEVRAYLKRERREYPPEFVAMTPMNVGARRDRSRLDEASPRDVQNLWMRYRNFHTSRHLIPPETLYALWVYARNVEPMTREQVQNALHQVLPPYLLRRDWATLGEFSWADGSLFGERYGQGGELDANRMFTGLVGALRLATQVGDPERLPVLWGQFALTAMRRYAMGRYADFLYQDKIIFLPTDPAVTKEQWEAYCGGILELHPQLVNQYGRPEWQVLQHVGSATGCLKTYQWTTPQDDVRAVVRMNEYGVLFNDTPLHYNGAILARYAGVAAPELARFLAEVERDQARRFVDRVAGVAPDWYLAYSTARIASEVNYHHPSMAHDQFMVRALVLQEPPEKLARYLDVPWVERGDLYYIHKLAETIRAYRGAKWSQGADQPGPLALTPECETQVPKIWPVPALGNENLPAQIPPAPEAFKIDGDFAKWGAVKALPAPFAKKDAGRLKLAWNRGGLFGCLQTQDKEIVVKADGPWSGDCLELWMETDFARAADLHGHTFQLAVAPNPAGGEGPCVVMKGSGAIDPQTVASHWKKTSDGYELEFFIPAESLAPARFAPATKLGFNYSVDDNGKSVEQFFSDKDVDEGYRTPMTWGAIKLAE